MRSAGLFVVLCGFVCGFPRRNPSELIFGGTKASEGQWPSYAFISMHKPGGGSSYCGASLITTRHVLTAAHCIPNIGNGSVVMLGIVDRESAYNNSEAQIINVKTTLVHPDYNRGASYHNDIGVVTLETPAKITTNVQLAKIRAKDESLTALPSGDITGYGTYKFIHDNQESSRYLLFANVSIVDFKWCKDRWYKATGKQVDLWESQMCAGANGTGIGPGDSGGPIQVLKDGWYQVGLASFVADGNAIMANQAAYPGVFTRVAKFCDFIQTSTNNEFKCE